MCGTLATDTNPELDEAKLAQLRRGANLDSTVVVSAPTFSRMQCTPDNPLIYFTVDRDW